MKTIERQIDIAADPTLVWRVMTDVAHWPDWTKSVETVRVLVDGPLRIDTKVQVIQPRLPKAVWTVTAVEEGRYFEWRNESPGLHSLATHLVESTPSGARVTLSVQWSGPLSGLIALLYGKLSAGYVEMEAAGLKRQCEALQSHQESAPD